MTAGRPRPGPAVEARRVGQERAWPAGQKVKGRSRGGASAAGAVIACVRGFGGGRGGWTGGLMSALLARTRTEMTWLPRPRSTQSARLRRPSLGTRCAPWTRRGGAAALIGNQYRQCVCASLGPKRRVPHRRPQSRRPSRRRTSPLPETGRRGHLSQSPVSVGCLASRPSRVLSRPMHAPSPARV